MSWNRETASNRIDDLMSSVPNVTIDNFDSRVGLILEKAKKQGLPTPSNNQALFNISREEAVLVDGVHIYANLANYNEFRLKHGTDSEAAHKKALNYLHLHYQATDRLIEAFGAQRVDFHGGRMHCVIVDPIESEEQRILKALEFSVRLQKFLDEANNQIAEGGYDATLRIGLDSGRCIAINSGKGSEDEPLFLGGPANYAAKLAVGDEPGIFPSSRIRKMIKFSPTTNLMEERSFQLGTNDLAKVLTVAAANPTSFLANFDSFDTQSSKLLSEWREDKQLLKSETGGASTFKFHSPDLPLSNLKFSELSPGNSARMEMISLFADVDNYTKYIDDCQQSGKAAEAVRALHVIRGELANVLKYDFGGRKVRFIGDCIHGLCVAVNSDGDVERAKSVKEAIECSAAMVSSFELIQDKLPNTKQLGLATGIDISETPISRIGIRGDRSVRAASSSATINSQIAQEDCNDETIHFECALADSAYEALSQRDKLHFHNQKISNLDYDGFVTLFGTIAAPQIAKAHSPSKVGPVEDKSHIMFQ